MLSACTTALATGYDLVMLDLDGVVYIGDQAVPRAPEAIGDLRSAGRRVAFLTNNAARPPEVVAEHLTHLGIAAKPGEVVTSAQAVAGLIAAQFGDGAPTVCLGGPGLRFALAEAGVHAVSVEDEAVAVVTGYGPDVLWRDIMKAAVRIREGLPWFASNTDATIPTQFGIAPGHGVLVETLARFAQVSPTVAGKPERPLFDEAVRRAGGGRPLMVGDRLDTDIEGAGRAGCDSLLVMTGVTGLPELAAAPASERPTFIAACLDGLLVPHPAPKSQRDGWALGGWVARVSNSALVVTGEGSPDDWWRTAAAAAWAHLDAVGVPADTSGLVLPSAERTRG